MEQRSKHPGQHGTAGTPASKASLRSLLGFVCVVMTISCTPATQTKKPPPPRAPVAAQKQVLRRPPPSPATTQAQKQSEARPVAPGSTRVRFGPQPPPGQTGSMDFRRRVAEVIRRHWIRFSRCQQASWQRRCDALAHNKPTHEDPRALLVLRWKLQPDGSVKDPAVETNQTHSPALGACMRKALTGLRFPHTPTGESLVVRYPFRCRCLAHCS